MHEFYDLDHLTHPLSYLSEAPHFRNKLLSVSRMELYERCPYAFFQRYIKHIRGEPSLPLMFGSACHAPLEDVYRWVINEEFTGNFPKKQLLEAWGKHYEEMGLTLLADASFDAYAAGADIMCRYAANNPEVDHSSVLAVEQKFEVQCGDWELIGYMDRVDRIERGGKRIVRINDYKTNRMLMTRDEAKTKLQASLYIAAAQKLYPWADEIEFTFDMLRHGVKIHTDRTTDELDAAFRYMQMTARMSEERGYPAKVNTLCGWCDYRSGCEAYQEALTSATTLERLQINVPEALDEISKEREFAAMVAAAGKKRKEEMEKLLKVAFTEKEGAVHAGGMIYSWNRVKKRGGVKYDDDSLIDFLVEQGIDEKDKLIKRLMVVDKTKLTRIVTAWCKKHEIKGAKKKMLMVEMESHATIEYSTRLDARKDT